MISLEDAVTARLESHGTRFEVLVDPDAALAIKRGEFEGDLEDIIAAEDVFENASRGDRPAETDLEDVFGTTDPMEIITAVIWISPRSTTSGMTSSGSVVSNTASSAFSGGRSPREAFSKTSSAAITSSSSPSNSPRFIASAASGSTSTSKRSP